jgi:hypothetical protein
MIPLKVDIFTYYPNSEDLQSKNIQLNKIEFTKLGFVTFEDNSKSNYTMNILKSVNVDSPAMLIKVVITGCHSNDFNEFN